MERGTGCSACRGAEEVGERRRSRDRGVRVCESTCVAVCVCERVSASVSVCVRMCVYLNVCAGVCVST